LYLLSGFEDKITCLSPGQLQVFTYANLADDLDPASIELSLFHLRRLYPLSYIPAHDYNLAEEEVTHHFEKVYYGVAAEGTAVIVRPDDQESLFNYSQTIINRYLWIYLLVMHQRFALLNIFPYADHAIFDFTQYKKQDLFHLTDWTSKIRQLCRYERVSHNTPTNHFYQLCRRNLGIPELLKEVDESVKELQRKLQEFNL
jgi:hypothetical protein